MNWDKYFIDGAFWASTKSKDPSTKVGAVIVGQENEVISTGFNGFPRGVRETHGSFIPANDPGGFFVTKEIKLSHRWDRPAKYDWVEHAERNAIYNAARVGTSTNGCCLYLNWEPVPCIECAKAIIQAGIVEVVGPNREFTRNKDWKFDIVRTMFQEAGVIMRIVPYEIDLGDRT